MTTAPRVRSPMTLERLTRYVHPAPRSERALRYRGEDRGVALRSLPERDREAVRSLYALLMDFDAALRAAGPGLDEASVAEALARSFELDRAFEAAHAIGASEGAGLPDEARHALHDARSGALTSLFAEIHRIRFGRGERTIRALRTLTTDQLKVMRNAFLELDDALRLSDLEPKEHPIERLAETLQRVTGQGLRGDVSVEVHRSFVGAITMCCVELGALDRAALNLLNNAVRHSATDRVEVALVPTTREPGSDLCVCVANALEESHAQALHARFGDALSRLFIDPYTTTGSGDGLKICVDFVASAYGLARGAHAVDAGLVGAAIEAGWFVAWLHWPAVA